MAISYPERSDRDLPYRDACPFELRSRVLEAVGEIVSSNVVVRAVPERTRDRECD